MDAQNFLVVNLPNSARIQFEDEATELAYKRFEFEKVAFSPKRQCVLAAKINHEEHKDLYVHIDFSNIEGTRDLGSSTSYETLKAFDSWIQLKGYVDVGTTAKAKRLHSIYLLFSTVKIRDRAGKALTILVESCKTQEPI